MLNVEIKNSIATLTLNRPEVHNAFNDELIAKMIASVEKINKDQSIRLVILQAEGKSFCAGADLNWMKSMADYSEAENYKDSIQLANLFKSINELAFPVIGLCHGAALGGGVGLIAVCDFVLAAESAKFGFTEVRLGLVPAVISTFVVDKIGKSNARAWFLSGERFDAKTAKEMHLVHEVVSDKEFSKRASEVIKSFLKAAPKAPQICKKMLRDTDQLEETAKIIAKVRVSAEGQEGMKALLEKRQAKW